MIRAAFSVSLALAILSAACGGEELSTSSGTGGTASGATVGTGASGGGEGGASASGGAGGQSAGSGGQGGSVEVPLDGFGTITGDCGVIDPAELVSDSPPFQIVNHIDFGAMAFDGSLLSMGGQAILDDPNAGGSSKESEAIAFEVLHRCELASLIKTETEIVYDAAGVLTDLLVELDGLTVGVSVVRAFAFMADYTVEDASTKMTEKLLDIQESTANVSAEDAWSKQILAVIAEKPENATAVATALGMIEPSIRGDTIVLVTVTDGDDAFVY